jgi:hypothetical protein
MPNVNKTTEFPAVDSNGNPNNEATERLKDLLLQFSQCPAGSSDLTPLLEFVVRELPCAVVADPALFLEDPLGSPLYEALSHVWNTLRGYRSEALEIARPRFSIILSCLAASLTRLTPSPPCELLMKEICEMLEWVANPYTCRESIEMDIFEFSC